MNRILSSMFAGTVAIAFALPAVAYPAAPGSTPSCGEDKGGKKEEKDPAAVPQCGEDKGGKKEEKDPAAVPQCGEDKGGKKEEKDPARI